MKFSWMKWKLLHIVKNLGNLVETNFLGKLNNEDVSFLGVSFDVIVEMGDISDQFYKGLR